MHRVTEEALRPSEKHTGLLPELGWTPSVATSCVSWFLYLG